MVPSVSVRALGVDYGRKRIGLALSDQTGMLSRPWKAIDAGGGVKASAARLAREIAALREEEGGLDVVVLGLPRRLSGAPNEQTAAVQALAAELGRQAGIPLVLQDERLSSIEAESLLSRSEKDWRKRKPLLDATSAAVILQDYLDSRARPASDALEPSA